MRTLKTLVEFGSSRTVLPKLLLAPWHCTIPDDTGLTLPSGLHVSVLPIYLKLFDSPAVKIDFTLW